MNTHPRPQLRWVPVVDAAGHRHLEMRWTCTGTPGQASLPSLRAA